MNVNGYEVTEKYVQQYVRECIVKTKIDLKRIMVFITTSFYTPMTYNARRAPKRKVKI